MSGNPLSLPHPTHLNIPSSSANNNLLVLSNLLENQPRLGGLQDKDKEGVAAAASLMSVSPLGSTDVSGTISSILVIH